MTSAWLNGQIAKKEKDTVDQADIFLSEGI
jgi:hypothetical protein